MGIFAEHPDSAGGVLKALHGLEKCPGGIGRSDPDRHSTFAYVGDVDGIDIQMVKFESDIFQRTAEIKVANSIEKHNDLLVAKPDKSMMGPLDDTYKNR